MSGYSRGRPRGEGGGSRGYSPGRGSGASEGRGSGGRGRSHDRGGGDFRRGGGGGSSRGGAGPPGIFNPNIPLRTDERLRDNELNSVIERFKSLQVTSPIRPLRPGYGTRGIEVTLRANFFPVKLPKDLLVYDYQVQISPEVGIRRIKARIFRLLEGHPDFRPFLDSIAHDGSQRLVSSVKLPQNMGLSLAYTEEGETAPRETTYTIMFVPVRTLDTNDLTKYMKGQPDYKDYDPAPLIGALNLVLQRRASQTGIRMGQDRDDEKNKNKKNDRNKYFFPLSSHKHQLSPGVVAILGFYASVRPSYKQLMVNVNACMAAFIDIPDNMVDALLAFSRRTQGAMPTLPPHLVRSITVTTKYLGYKKRSKVYAIGTTSARNTFFPHDKYGKISVENYFKKVYPALGPLRHATDVPVIDIRNPSKRTPVWVPAELCLIEPGQPYRAKLSSFETSQMIKVACVSPTTNAQSIVGEGFSRLGFLPPTPPASSFGITVSNEMAVIPARELAPPRIEYAPGTRPSFANSGSWNVAGDVKFYRSATVKSWWIMVVRDSEGNMNELVANPQDLIPLRDAFNKKLVSKGLRMPSTLPRLVITEGLPSTKDDPSRKRALNLIRNALQKEIDKGNAPEPPDFILVLLAHVDNYIYPGIKKICDSEFGVSTVHLQLQKAMNPNRNQLDQYLSNVALKVNTKLGGINHQLDRDAMKWLRKKKTMMVGIDVTHRGPGSKDGTPSIAAVVANVDEDFVQFPASLRIQGTHDIREMVVDLRDMMVERLVAFEKKTKTLPERIFVFRDGVSEGQYDIVISSELAQILEAFKRFNTGGRGQAYRPQVSIIVCGKRHHARFFPTDAANASANGNTRPGTVVDKGVTGVFDFDFYLQAHAGIKGTVRPTHYVVIYDETRFTADEIQQGTHDTSYLYARATRSVSLVPPAYYADLACERGRCYLNDFLVGESSERGSSSGRSDKEAEKQRVFEAARQAWGRGVHPRLRDTMFYI
ncbi:argonaute-like protein [Marasmius fiardii PR-910]|nr:argonaute-like protein [Marasmius fiardii PR-910]